MYKQALKMNNGRSIPMVGFGSYKVHDPAMTKQCLAAAWEAGYRHIDTAVFYKNEQEIGDALRELKIPRDEVFITSKIWVDDISYKGTRRSVEESLAKLQVDHIDLMLIHWPGAATVQDRVDCWRALEEFVAEGKLLSIGVSNFLPRHIETILAGCKIVPAVNQIEVHPLFYDAKTIEYCQKHGIVVEAYSPLARGDKELLEHPHLVELAKKYGKSVGQVILRWLLQLDLVVLPKSEQKERIRANIELDDFELTKEEVEEIKKLNKSKKCCEDPETVLD